MLPEENQFCYVRSFEDLVSVPYTGSINAICWKRELVGDFAEIVNKINTNENIVELDEEDLYALELSDEGQVAREILVGDLARLRDHGASPILNLIKCYDSDGTSPYFSTDVYSYHVDRSPVPTHTFLCTYYGESREIISNSQAEQKILIPEIRNELQKLYRGPAEGFESFFREHFFDLHYRAKPDARPMSLGLGNIWRLAVDYPESKVLPCIHRAPNEEVGVCRLLLIC